MKTVCAWCDTVLAPGDDREITHAICAKCVDNMAFQEGVDLKRYLDSLEQPVMAVDADVVMVTANTAACAMLGKTLNDLEQQRGGNVFECAYARLPGGCGRTIHCSGCTIRRSVNETCATGQSCLRVPAQLTQHPEDPRQVDLFITTEKVGGYVLLRIDAANESSASS